MMELLYKFQKAKLFAVLSAFVILLIALAVGFEYQRSPPPPAKPLIGAAPVDEVNRKVVMMPEETGEHLRILHLKDDLATVGHAEVWFRDGGIGHIDYRDDGTVSTFSAHYKAVAGNRQLKMEGAYLPDGVTLMHENHYREDGTASMRGKRIAGIGYEVKQYFEDGVKLASVELFDKHAEVLEGTHWYKGGAVKRTIHRDELSARVTNDFREDGSKSHYHWVFYSREVWETYQTDGVTPITRFEMKSGGNRAGVSYHVHAHYYNPDGSLNHERKFGNAYMKVIFRDGEGDIIFTQRWLAKEQVSKPEQITDDNYYLGMIVLGGEELVGNDSIFLYENGVIEKTMFKVDLKGDDKLRYQIKEYDEEGFLTELDQPQMVDGEVKTLSTTYEEDARTVKFDPGELKPEWIKVYPFTLPPKAPPENVGGAP